MKITKIPNGLRIRLTKYEIDNAPSPAAWFNNTLREIYAANNRALMKGINRLLNLMGADPWWTVTP